MFDSIVFSLMTAKIMYKQRDRVFFKLARRNFLQLSL
jgi:hypothetical protein